MKKWLAVCISICLTAVLTACGSGAGNQDESPNPELTAGTMEQTEAVSEEQAEALTEKTLLMQTTIHLSFQLQT